MKKKFHAQSILFPDGREVLRGPNGYLNPPVPCDHCGRAIRYYKGPIDQFPWFCSQECRDRIAVKTRCDCCRGAMRKPVLFGTDSTGKKWVACKSCCLRMAYLFHRLSNLEVPFVQYALQKALPAILKGELKTMRFRVVGTNFLYVSKDTPTDSLPDLPPELPTRTVKTKEKSKEPEKPKEPPKPKVDVELQERILKRYLDKDGYWFPGQGPQGVHFREKYPHPDFPPPPPRVSPPTDA